MGVEALGRLPRFPALSDLKPLCSWHLGLLEETRRRRGAVLHLATGWQQATALAQRPQPTASLQVVLGVCGGCGGGGVYETCPHVGTQTCRATPLRRVSEPPPGPALCPAARRARCAAHRWPPAALLKGHRLLPAGLSEAGPRPTPPRTRPSRLWPRPLPPRDKAPSHAGRAGRAGRAGSGFPEPSRRPPLSTATRVTPEGPRDSVSEATSPRAQSPSPSWSSRSLHCHLTACLPLATFPEAPTAIALHPAVPALTRVLGESPVCFVTAVFATLLMFPHI